MSTLLLAITGEQIHNIISSEAQLEVNYIYGLNGADSLNSLLFLYGVLSES